MKWEELQAIKRLRNCGTRISGRMVLADAGEDLGPRLFKNIQPDWNEMLDAIEAGDEQDAAQAFQTAVLEAYGAPACLTIVDIEFGMQIGPDRRTERELVRGLMEAQQALDASIEDARVQSRAQRRRTRTA